MKKARTISAIVAIQVVASLAQASPDSGWRPPKMSYAHALEFALLAINLPPEMKWGTANPVWKPSTPFYWIDFYLDTEWTTTYFITVNRYTGDVWQWGNCGPYRDIPKLVEKQDQRRAKLARKHFAEYDKLRLLRVQPWFEGCREENYDALRPLDTPLEE